MKIKNNWFTLIEIVVSIAIFSLIMISMISIYILSSETSLKSDINRAMHENIKSVVTDISEDVIKNWIKWVSFDILDSCDFVSTTNYKIWNKLCTKTSNYYLAKEDLWNYIRIDDPNYCKLVSSQCYIVKDWSPLTNSLVTIRELKFYISSLYVPKVTVNIVIQPTTKAWVKPNLIEKNKIIFQTTISERPF